MSFPTATPIETVTTEFVAVRKLSPATQTIAENEAQNMRKLARQHYVTARFSLTVGYSITGCLLAHQCLEAYLKGLLRLYGKESQRGHNLAGLLGYGGYVLKIPEFAEISENKDTIELMKQLGNVYDTLRFGEDAGFFIENENTFLELDAVVFALETIYSRRLNEPKVPKIYVYEALRNRFLKFNDFFTPEMISNNPPSRNGDAEELIGESAWKHIFVSDIEARNLNQQIQFVHVPKRIPKEHQTTSDENQRVQ